MNAATLFETVSVCPECYREIPAQVVRLGGEAVMRKRCAAHGPFSALVERDADLYLRLRAARGAIYPGHFIDVTRRCNLSCPYCYYPCGKGEDPSADAIIQEAATLRGLGPFFLTGGEPTLRDDLVDLARQLAPLGGAAMPTNGHGLRDRDRLRELLRWIGRYDGVAMIALSHHGALNAGTFGLVIEHLRSMGERISGPIFTVRSLDELPSALATARAIRDVTDYVRIHVAAEIWDAGDPAQIFLSDLVGRLRALAKAEGVDFSVSERGSRTMWLRASYDGLRLGLARWCTRWDIDLEQLDCPPTYRARSGEVVHLTYGFIINEGIDHGWLKGRRLDALSVKTGAA